MDRDLSYDEAITPPLGLGVVVVMAGPGKMDIYNEEVGISFSLTGEKLTFDPLDGPIKLEQWGAGAGVAFDGSLGSPEQDPDAHAVCAGTTHLYGVLPSGQWVFTAPLTEVQRYTPGNTPFATVVDGLVFQLGVPDHNWVQAGRDEFADQPGVDVVEMFLQSFSPLNLQPMQGGVQ